VVKIQANYKKNPTKNELICKKNQKNIEIDRESTPVKKNTHSEVVFGCLVKMCEADKFATLWRTKSVGDSPTNGGVMGDQSGLLNVVVGKFWPPTCAREDVAGCSASDDRNDASGGRAGRLQNWQKN
jgi:hypothetical protein